MSIRNTQSGFDGKWQKTYTFPLFIKIVFLQSDRPTIFETLREKDYEKHKANAQDGTADKNPLFLD